MAQESDGKAEAADEGGFVPDRLNEAVYHQLKGAARTLLRRRRKDEVSLSPSTLVHDAWVRLAANERATWRSEAHFRSAAAAAMRHILVDRARRKRTEKHGTGWARVTLTGGGQTPIDVRIEALSDALERLSSFDPRGAEIVEMRFLAGMTNVEIASVLEVSERTVERDWRAARAWLLEALTD